MKKINRKPFDRQPAQLPPEEFTSYFRLIKWTSIDHQGQAQLFIDEACKESNIPNLLIDLSDTPWLNSLELGVLLTLGRWAKKHECQLLVTGLAGRLSAWLNINGLESLFQVLKPEQDWQEFTEMKIGGFTVLSPAYGTLRFIPPPELTATTLPDWKEKIKNILMERSPEIIRIEIEAEHLSFLDSAGLEYLIHLRKEVKMLTLEWELYNLKGAPLTTLKLSRMESLLR
jgi:anti-anti-sigma regulatory factor